MNSLLDISRPIPEAIGKWRKKRAARTLELALERSGLDEQGLADRMEADEDTSAFVEEALEAGARTPHEAKRFLLAAVVADALKGGTMPVDLDRQLLRTVAEVEPLDVHYLACFRATAQAKGEQWLRPEDVEGSSIDTLVTAPTAAALVHAGLLQSSGGGGYGPSNPVIEVTRWGNHFLDWLDEAEPNFTAAK